jgi:hypothetical protein
VAECLWPAFKKVDKIACGDPKGYNAQAAMKMHETIQIKVSFQRDIVS